MSNVSQFYNKQDIQEKACLLISQMDRGLSISEKQNLVAWINQSKLHHNILLEMASYWDDLSVLNELSGLFPLEKAPKKSVKKLVNIAMAASLAFVSILGANFIINGSYSPFSIQQSALAQMQTYQTAIGEQARYSLPDGTTMQLNTNSIVEIAYTPTHRLLTLTKGEARFDVAKDKTRPFTVTAGKKSFTALGTIFNVQKNNEQAMELVVTEGRVLITKAGETLTQITKGLSTLSEEQLPGVLVTSGEKAIIVKNITGAVQTVSLDQVQRELAWQQGMLIFDGIPLEQALAEVSRYTVTTFDIIDPQLAKLNVAGYFKAGDIEGLLASLESNFNIVHSKNSDNSVKLSLNTNEI